MVLMGAKSLFDLNTFYFAGVEDNTMANLSKDIDHTSQKPTNASSSDSNAVLNGLFMTFYAILIILGLFGNFCVIKVVLQYRPMRRRSTNRLLVNLAVADILTLAVCSPIVVTELQYDRIWPLGQLLCQLSSFLENLSTIASLFTIILIALERYHLLNGSYDRIGVVMNHTNLVLLCIWIAAVCVCIPSIHIPQLKESRTHNGEMCIANVTQYWKKVYLVLMDIFMYIIPLLGLVAVYGLMVQKIYRSIRGDGRGGIELSALQQRNGHATGRNNQRENHQEMQNCLGASYDRYELNGRLDGQHDVRDDEESVALGGRQTPSRTGSRRSRCSSNPGQEHVDERHNAITLILAITVMYFACILPFRIVRICFAFKVVPPGKWIQFGIVNFARLMYYANSCANIVVYVLASTMFRESLKDYFSTWSDCCCEYEFTFDDDPTDYSYPNDPAVLGPLHNTPNEGELRDRDNVFPL